MFTDMVGYTALGQRNELLSLALVEEQRKVVRPILSRHNGREVKTIGDAFLVEFPNAVDAVRCAYDIQRAVREYNLSLDSDKRIHLRIGVHVGEVVDSQGDISGDAVNVASRIEPLAEDGGVSLTRQVYDNVYNKIDLPVTSVGLRQLKNVDAPVEVYRLEMPWEAKALEQATELDLKRVAILPFASMSPDPNDEFFADGLTEELIDRLCQVGGLGVIARTSVMNYKGQKKNASQIGKELRAGGLVEGSIRKSGNKIRVTAQLINANTEEHLWSSHYDKDLNDIFAVQSDIAEAVALALRGRLLPAEKKAIEEKPTEDTEAYTSFLQGMQLVYQDEPAPLRNAIALFEQAASRDPKFARAYAGLSKCYTELGDNSYMQWQEAIDKAKVAAEKAIEINPDLAEAHCRLANVMFMGDQPVEARRAELHRALELNPNLAEAHWQLAQESAMTGDLAQTVSACEKAYQLDPLNPDIVRLLGLSYFFSRRYDEMLAHSKKTYHLNPYGTSRYLFDYYVNRGDFDEAKKCLDEMEKIGPTRDYTFLNRGLLAAVTGDVKTAQEMINRLDEMHEPGWGRSSFAGFVYLELGNVDKFFEYMFQSAADHTLIVATVRFNPLLEKARADPRFPEVFRRAGVKY